MSSRVTLSLCVVALLVVLGLAPSQMYAAGGTYVVRQCDSLNRLHPDARMDVGAVYAVRSFCGDTEADYSLRVDNLSDAITGRRGRVRWRMPVPELRIVGVYVRAKLRRDNRHLSRLWMADANLNETRRIATGDQGLTGFEPYRWSTTGNGHSQFVASLSCESSDGCPKSGDAKTWIRNVQLTIRDSADPVLTELDGSLLDEGWLRAGHGITARVEDIGAGVSRLEMTVNGLPLIERAFACTAINGTIAAQRLQPCNASDSLSAAIDTEQSPFQDGLNNIRVCVRDFAANEACERGVVRVDNAAPQLAFTSSQDPEDPELVAAQVADPHSGLAAGQIWYRQIGHTTWRPALTEVGAGELRARIDTAGEPPGQYEFKAEATDIAGNRSETTLRSDGQRMVLSFPLRAGTDLSAYLVPGGSEGATIRYGRDSKVSGRLTEASGEPIAGQEVTVTEYFGDGALIDRRVRAVTTDASGYYGSKLPAGPSRRVYVSYDGSPRYLPEDIRGPKLNVKSSARFWTSRRNVPEGGRVAFLGKVRHLGARIPAGGKLIELQVREGPQRWSTVREAFYTRSDGSYRLRYRFGRFYRVDVRYQFRVKVAREQGWPYKAPVRSRRQTVTVLAN